MPVNFEKKFSCYTQNYIYDKTKNEKRKKNCDSSFIYSFLIIVIVVKYSFFLKSLYKTIFVWS